MMSGNDYLQLSRILLLIPRLTKKEGVSIAKVCSDLQISREQLIKDIELISMTSYGDFGGHELIDICIERDKLYVYTGGLFKRPMRLTYGEVLALKIGSELVSQQGLFSDQQEMYNLREKIEQLAVIKSDEIRPANLQFEYPDTTPRKVIQTLLQALKDKCKIQVHYYTASRNKFSEKILHLYYLVCHNLQWYLIAYCPDVKEIRRYRMDRMNNLEILPNAFRMPKKFSVREHLSDNMYISPKSPQKLTLRFHKTVTRWIMEVSPKGVLQKDGSCIFTRVDAAVIVGGK